MTEPTTAQRLRAQHTLYPIHASVGVDYEELNRASQLTVDKVARLIAEIENPIRELHQPYGIYTECGHEHTQEQLEDDLCFEVDLVGLVCDEGLMYQICQPCCVEPGWAEGYQLEHCANGRDGHDHGPGKPHCATIALLDSRVPVNQ